MKLDLGQILTVATAVPGIVKNIQAAFGHHSGAEKKAAAMDAAASIVAATNGIAKEEVLNDQGVSALLSEAIELGVTIMKAEQRLEEIKGLIQGAKGSGQQLGG